MPSIEVDVSSVPDIIEAQLTLSYSRLTDLIRVIVDQGNGHEDDIEEIRDRLAKLAHENGALRSEVEALKQAKGPSAEVTAALAELKSAVVQLNEQSDANAAAVAAAAEAQKTFAAESAKQAAEHQAAMRATLADHASSLDRRLSAVEKSLRTTQAFTDLWGTNPQQLMEMGRRTSNSEMEHSLADRTTYLLSMSPFAKMHEEMEVLRALMQRQAADALAAKTSEAARSSRTGSYVAGMSEGKDHTGEIEGLTSAVRALELQMQLVQQQRLPPLEAALGDLKGRSNAEERLGNAEKDVNRLYDQLAQLEDRLNTLLGLSEQKSAVNTDAASPALVDLARRLSMLEGTVEGWPRGSTPLQSPANLPGAEAAAAAAAGGGEAASADAAGRLSMSRGQIGRPPSGRPGGSGVLPTLSKDLSGSASFGAAAARVSPPPRRSSSLVPGGAVAHEAAQPTVDALRKEEVSQPSLAANRRRISVAVEPDDGLRRRVTQLEENTAILEVNKADRKELQQLEVALREAMAGMSRASPLQQQQQQTPTSNSSPLVPQRPSSTGARYSNASGLLPAELMPGQQRAIDSFSRPASSGGALGRPMFVGSSSVYLRDGAQLTNATVSSNSQNSA